MSQSATHHNGPDSDSFYTVLIEGLANDDAFVQVFFTWAGSIGEAIDKVTRVAIENEGIDNPMVSEADPYDYNTLPGEVGEIGATSVFSSGGRFYFPADEPVFRIPDGVVLSCIEGEFDPEELRSGFLSSSEGKLLRIDCAVPGGELETTFNALVSSLPDIRVSWVECSDEWDDAPTRQFYTNESLNAPELVRDFIRGETRNILCNGMVKFTVYSDEGRTNLLIDDHKVISILTYSDRVRDTMARKLQSLGFEPVDDLKKVQRGLHHWHYQPVTALPRREFVTHLLDLGFSLWKEIPAHDE